MKNTIKKILCTLLVVVVCLTCLPIGYASAETAQIPDDAVEFNGHYYKVVTEYMAWEDAKIYCESLGGHLVTITSQEENDVVLSLIASHSNIFMTGLSDVNKEGEWSWVTGEPVTYTNWANRQPDNHNNQDSGAIVSYNNDYGVKKGQWDDVAYVDGHYFICEWDISDTVSGTLTGSSTLPQIKIDNTWYEYDTSVSGLAEAIDRFAIGSIICCKLKRGKIVACSQNGISNGAMVTVNTSNINTIKYSADTKKYDITNIDLGISVTNRLISDTYGPINTAYLAGYDITFDKIILKTSEKDLLCFKGGLFSESYELEINLNSPIVVNAGNMYYLNEKTQVTINNNYKWGDTETKKEVTITALAYNGDELIATDTETISFLNQSAIDNLKNIQETEKESQVAANLLDNTTSVLINSFLSEIFTTQELKTIQNALECKIALSALPKSVYEKAGIEERVMNKIMSKLGVSKDWFGITYTADISMVVHVDTQKYGQLEITFNSPVTFHSFGSDNPFAGTNFGISYEVTGGKGKKNVPEESLKGNPVGMLVFANVQNFKTSVEKIALAQLESAYNLGYGNDLNKVGEMLIGETFTKILSKTSAKSYSHLTFTMMTFPSKMVSVRCPVDVYLYNSAGELCASVIDNSPEVLTDDIDIVVIGDEKYIDIYEGEYTIDILATAKGTMDIQIEEYTNTNEKIHSVDFDKVALEPGDNFTASITEYYVDSVYEIEKNKKEIINSDKDEVLIHYPALVETIEKDSTCCEEGLKRIECTVCEETITTETLPMIAHIDNNSDSLCDSCGENLSANSNNSTTCSHLCHKNGFMGFIWKIIRFFFKLLGSNKVCTCGVAHY